VPAEEAVITELALWGEGACICNNDEIIFMSDERNKEERRPVRATGTPAEEREEERADNQKQ
jgi:hypothetical protein